MGRLVSGDDCGGLRDVLDAPAVASGLSAKDAPAEPEVVEAGEDFITGFGLVLTSWVEPTKAVIDRPSRVTPFHSVRVPPICIKDYLRRIRKYFVCTDECFVLALIYIDRVAKIDAVMAVCALNVHRLLLVTVMLGAKFNDDVYYSNAYYAKVGGMALKEVNALEARLLKMLSWHLLVEPVEYQLYHSLVCKATTITDAAMDSEFVVPPALTQTRKVQL